MILVLLSQVPRFDNHPFHFHFLRKQMQICAICATAAVSSKNLKGSESSLEEPNILSFSSSCCFSSFVVVAVVAAAAGFQVRQNEMPAYGDMEKLSCCLSLSEMARTAVHTVFPLRTRPSTAECGQRRGLFAFLGVAF